MTPRLLSVDVQSWANRLTRYLDSIRSLLQFKTPDAKASQDGIILWDNDNGYPVVTKDGEFRQVVLSDGKFTATCTTSQTASAANTAYTIPWDTVSVQDGITVSNGEITIGKPGVYIVTFTAQIASNNIVAKHFWFWPRLNGANMSGGTIKASAYRANSIDIVSRSILFNFSANDIIEARWAVDNTGGWLDAASSTAFAPASPAATISIIRICR